jgi:hypothetical protein
MRKKATKDTTTSRKICRRTETHTKALTRKKEAEPHQAKEQCFFKTTVKILGNATFNLTGTFNNSKQSGQLQQKGQMEDLD